MKLLLATVILALLLSSACVQQVHVNPLQRPGTCDEEAQSDPLPLPSTMPLQDYEKQVLYPWLFNRSYAGLPGWKVDTEVRDTGPFIQGKYYGTHPAVRIHYSPEVVFWLEKGRPTDEPLPNGSMIIKEMYPPPAAIYTEIKETPYFQENPTEYEKLLATMNTKGWTVMIKDTCGKSNDGWLWAGPGPEGTSGNVDDYTHVLTSGFGLGTCIRCHASADSENTFASKKNFDPEDTPLQFRVDNSWRSRSQVSSILPQLKGFPGLPVKELEQLLAKLILPAQQRPWADSNIAGLDEFVHAHRPDSDSTVASLNIKPTGPANQQFVEIFKDLTEVSSGTSRRDIASFPPEFADHVYPGTKPQEYITSSNCYGCHGGLGGAPSGVSQFISTGPNYGDGYNISPYGEWRWSPMGLAGRDPIFHSQIETEMIILLDENGQLDNGKPAVGEVLTTQQALVDTCLRCHGAMGVRQKGLDSASRNILNPEFDIDLFYIAAPLTKAEEQNPPFTPPARQPFPPQVLNYHDWEYGDLAREGISCAICHNIAPPDKETADHWASMIRADKPDWLGTADNVVWTDSFFYFMGLNNTGLFERAPSNEFFGPFADVKQLPMQHALGITPKVAPPIDGDTEPFTQDSAMCGTCHTINLPIIGQEHDENPILTALEPNEHFKPIPHSIEQATYLEWLNSKFGLGKDNKKGLAFQSCQDCHMPNRFATVDNETAAPIKQLAVQIATIQDSSYPEAENQLDPEDIFVETRSDYRRHELVGLNAFMIEMFKQFPDILGVDAGDYESGANNGAEFAIENMLLSAKEGRIASVDVTSARLDGENLVVGVRVANKTGHRLPSGVAFRRLWVELLVTDVSGVVIWGSGRSNSAGLIVDNTGTPLPTELLTGGTVKVNGKEVDHQPNYQTITSDDQVQIYEELTKNASGKFTTSFVHRVEHVKDNRLLAEGWVPGAEFAGQTANAGIGNQGDLLKEFMEATDPDGVDGDPDFETSPSTGADNLTYDVALADLGGAVPAKVQATVYSQAFMPAWFYERFSLANEAKKNGYGTPATDRLYYIASHLNLKGTPMEDWKFQVATTGAQPISIED